MLTLMLFRHAKSSWMDSTLDDFARPLSSRGREAAPVMGRYMSHLGLRPDLVLCSTAKRARETLDLAQAELGNGVAVEFEQGLYLAAPGTLLRRIQLLGNGPDTVMIVGHNPGFYVLALDLIGAGEREDTERLAVKFPTAGLAVIAFRIERWADVRVGSGRLTHFLTPGRLAAAAE